MLQDRMRALGRSAQFLCPQLPPSPKAAIKLTQDLVAAVPADELFLIGSSLGGYYATWLAETSGCQAVLLNPAVTPLRDLEKYVGVLPAWHTGETFEFRREYLAELQALAIPRITRPERYWLLAATGDEVLDWREMTAHYAGAHQRVIEGSDHGLSDFSNYIDDVLRFCHVNPNP